MRRIFVISLLAVSCLFAACQSTGSTMPAAETTTVAQTAEAEKQKKMVSDTEEVTELSAEVSIRVLNDLGVDSSLLTEPFYRIGMENSLHFYMGGTDADSGAISCSFYDWDEETQEFSVSVASAEFETESGKITYTIQPDISEEYLQQKTAATETVSIPEKEWQISFLQADEGFLIRVSGAGMLEGDYFSRKQMLNEPDLLERYMSRADFYRYTERELRLLRNEIYAVHGALFAAEDLNTYFSKKPWYQGTIPTAAFTDDMLSDTEKTNLALIREMENMGGLMIDGKDYRAEYDALADAPYLSLLDQYQETGIHVDMRQAKDMGVYYAVPGEIRVPVTLTGVQMQALENGEEVEILLDELTGESRMLQKKQDIEPGVFQYLIYEKGMEPDENTMDASAVLDADIGLYTLWYMSHDTIMKNVYKGDIFLLKGAVRGDHLNLRLASREQRELKIPDSEEDIWNKEIWSNQLRHDGRGYITAVYCLGD